MPVYYFCPINQEDMILDINTAVYVVRTTSDTYSIKAISGGMASLSRLSNDPTSHATRYWPLNIETLLTYSNDATLFPEGRLTTNQLTLQQINDALSIDLTMMTEISFNQNIAVRHIVDWWDGIEQLEINSQFHQLQIQTLAPDTQGQPNTQAQTIPPFIYPQAENLHMTAAELYALYTSDNPTYGRLVHLSWYINQHHIGNTQNGLSREMALAVTAPEQWNLVSALPWVVQGIITLIEARNLTEDERRIFASNPRGGSPQGLREAYSMVQEHRRTRHESRQHGLFTPPPILNREMRITLTELRSHGLTEELLLSWQHSNAPTATVGRLEFTNRHREMLTYLIVEQHIVPTIAIQEINGLDAVETYTLMRHYSSHGLRGRHVRDFQNLDGAVDSLQLTGILEEKLNSGHSPDAILREINLLATEERSRLFLRNMVD